MHGLPSFPLTDRNGLAAHQQRVEIETDGVDALAVQRRRHQLPDPVRLRDNSARRSPRSAWCPPVVTHAAALERRVSPGGSADRRYPEPERGDVVRGPVGIRAVQAVAREDAVRSAGLRAATVWKSRPRRSSAAGGCWSKTSAAASGSSASARPSAVPDPAPHCAWTGCPSRTAGSRRDPDPTAAPHPGGITGRRFDLHDVGAPVREQTAGMDHHPDTEFDNSDALEVVRPWLTVCPVTAPWHRHFSESIYKYVYVCNACRVSETAAQTEEEMSSRNRIRALPPRC